MNEFQLNRDRKILSIIPKFLINLQYKRVEIQLNRVTEITNGIADAIHHDFRFAKGTPTRTLFKIIDVMLPLQDMNQ
jgi:hypothetical protein